jgi:hypothetical protein
MKEDEMGRKCYWHREIRNTFKNLVGKPAGKRQL